MKVLLLSTTLSRLKCPSREPGCDPCGGGFDIFGESFGKESLSGEALGAVFEVRCGHLRCLRCAKEFPILGGVAILVDDISSYLLAHVKGIARLIPDEEIPADYLSDYLEAKAEIDIEHIEEDLESERVVALYLATHYLRADPGALDPWWKPLPEPGSDAGSALPGSALPGSALPGSALPGSALPGSALIDQLIRQHWDQGPFQRIERWVAELAQNHPSADLLELGCGVGGLFPVLKKHLGSYLGVDSSFASIALARHLALGVPYAGSLKIPGDLLAGVLSREVKVPVSEPYDGRADFIVGGLDEAPVQPGDWDFTVALNTIDMLEDPGALPALQYKFLRKGGFAIQSCPYIWHASVAEALRARLPDGETSSARAVEWLYRQEGFEIEQVLEHVPWLFFKHARQLEIYSVHMFTARKLG